MQGVVLTDASLFETGERCEQSFGDGRVHFVQYELFDLLARFFHSRPPITRHTFNQYFSITQLICNRTKLTSVTADKVKSGETFQQRSEPTLNDFIFYTKSTLLH